MTQCFGTEFGARQLWAGFVVDYMKGSVTKEILPLLFELLELLVILRSEVPVGTNTPSYSGVDSENLNPFIRFGLCGRSC